MAKKNAPGVASALETSPLWPTFTRARLRGGWRDGLVLGTDNSVWLCRAVPLSPVADAKSDHDIDAAAAPLLAYLEELAVLSGGPGIRRSVARSSYREVHLLAVNLPQWWTPPADHPLRDYLAAMFPRTQETRARTTIVAVRLRDTVGGRGGLRGALDSIAETIVSGGTPIDDYEPDASRVAAAAERAGLTVPTDAQFRLANAWWNNGNAPDVYVMPQADCMHVFTHAEQAKAAARAVRERDVNWQDVASGTTITMASVQDLDLPFIPSNTDKAWWVTQLLGADALAVSIRGRIEPAHITRTELRRNRQRNEEDLRDRAQAGKMDRAELEEQQARLTAVENAYASGATPTLVDASVVVGFNGYVPDMNELSTMLTAKLNPLLERQRAAMAETMLASNVRANPHLHDLPAVALAYSGASGLSVVGDRPTPGAVLLGFSQRDKQAGWLDPMAAADEDSVPILTVVGQSGSGKLLDLSVTVPVPVSDLNPTGLTTIGELQVGDVVFGRDGRPCRVTALSPIVEEPDAYRITLSDGQSFLADSNHQWVVSDRWADSQARSAKRRAAALNYEQAHRRADLLDALAGEFGPDAEMTLRELHTFVTARVPGAPWRKASGLAASLRMMDAPFTVRSGEQAFYPVQVALKSLAARLRQQYAQAPELEPGERVMSTGEILDAGVLAPNGVSRFAIRLADPLDLPAADLPVDPYVLGARVAKGERIPAPYLRASYDQRLALLQGVMDTAGDVDAGGTSVASVRDAADVLALVRSLGIAAAGDGATVKFTTDKPVFRMPRKLERLPKPGTLRETSRWLYVTSIEKADPVPMRCLTVDSPDSTYLIGDFVPTHNTIGLQWLATQMSSTRPVVVVDPKPFSDLTGPVLERGGTVASLDDLESADGVFDPVRFSATPTDGVELAVAAIMEINPWGTADAGRHETDLRAAIWYGVQRGATCTGQALGIALRDGQIDKGTVAPIVKFAKTSPLFRACFGVSPRGDGLRVSSSITLIKAGSTDIAALAASDANSQAVRAARVLIRMMVYGSAMAVAGRDGAVALDEAWLFLQSGKGEIERLGRLARSQRVFPMMFTQRVTDLLKAELEGYISRGIILAIQSEDEARAACKLFEIEPTPERLATIMAADKIAAAGGGSTPNWNSMRALRDPVTGEVLRGSIGIYCDLAKRAVPTEIVIPPAFLKMASTNKRDIDARKADQRAAAAAKAAHEAAGIPDFDPQEVL